MTGFLLALAGFCGTMGIIRALRRDRAPYIYAAIGGIALAAAYLLA